MIPAGHYQGSYDVRCEWGPRGMGDLSPGVDCVIVVDVLSFSTCLDVAVGRGAVVIPCGQRDDAAVELARRHGAELSSPRGKGRYSLSPLSFKDIAAGERVVLASPNGAALTSCSKSKLTFSGCLRNAKAVAEAVPPGGTVLVVPAGEKWPDGTIRFAVEDAIGAGAIIAHLAGHKSPEAAALEALFRSAQGGLERVLLESVSGRQLVEMGFADDVRFSAELNVGDSVPGFDGAVYQRL